MAKLSARGRTELYRLAKTTMEQAGTADQYKSTRYYAVMSDKHVLKKSAFYNSLSALVSGPWNDLGRLTGDIAAYVAKLEAADYKPARP